MKRAETAASKLSTALLNLCSLVFKIGTIVFGLVASYLVFTALSGQLATATTAGAVSTLRFFGELLFVSGFFATLAVTIVTLEEVYWSIIAGAIGVVLLLGVPGMVVNSASGGAVPEAAQVVAWWGTFTGKAMILVVACRIIYEIYRQMTEGSVRKKIKEDERAKGRRKQIKVPKENIFAKCWQMPFCHDAVKELCPAFKAHKTCWKFGRGCNCDPDLVETLIASRVAGPARGARDTEGAFIRAEVEAEGPRSRSGRTIPCARCAIYTEHQRRKFKVINPLLIVITVALLSIFYVQLTGLYSTIAIGVAKLISGMGVSTQASAETLDFWKAYLDTPALGGAFVVIIGLFFLSWILKVGEWLVLEKKLV